MQSYGDKKIKTVYKKTAISAPSQILP